MFVGKYADMFNVQAQYYRDNPEDQGIEQEVEKVG